MSNEKQTISISIEKPLFRAIEDIAENEKVPIQVILEKALYDFVQQNGIVRENVMKHFDASLSKNYRLGKLLAK